MELPTAYIKSRYMVFQIHLHPGRGARWDCYCNPRYFVKEVLCLAKGHPSPSYLPLHTQAFQLSRFTWGSTKQVPQWLLSKLISCIIAWSFSPMPNCILLRIKPLFHHHISCCCALLYWGVISTDFKYLTSNFLAVTEIWNPPATMLLFWWMKLNESALCWLHTGSSLSGRSLAFHSLAGA